MGTTDKTEAKVEDEIMPVQYGTWFVVRDQHNVIAFLKYDEDAMDMALKYIREEIVLAEQYHYTPGERVTKITIEARYYPDLTKRKEGLETE